MEYSFGADPKFAETDEERALFAALDTAESEHRPGLGHEDFDAAMRAMAALRAPIDAFFEAVQINTDNSVVRRNRLNLLHSIRHACAHVADLTKSKGEPRPPACRGERSSGAFSAANARESFRGPGGRHWMEAPPRCPHPARRESAGLRLPAPRQAHTRQPWQAQPTSSMSSAQGQGSPTRTASRLGRPVSAGLQCMPLWTNPNIW